MISLRYGEDKEKDTHTLAHTDGDKDTGRERQVQRQANNRRETG